VENKILKACTLSRACWETMEQHKVFTGVSTAKVIYEEIGKYYTTDPTAAECDVDLLLKVLHKKYPKQHDIFTEWASRLAEVKASPENIAKYVLSLKETKLLEDIQIAAQQGQTARVIALSATLPDLGLVSDSLDKYEIYAGADISTMLTKHKKENLIAVYPKGLTQALDGGIPRGINTNILIFAETEMGKSLFGINMAYGFCKQGLKVVYVNNEESVERILIRFMLRFCNHDNVVKSLQDLQDDYKSCHDIAVASGWSNLSVIPLGPGNITDLHTLAASGCDVLMIDQLLNLDTNQDDGVASKTAISKALRSVGKTHNIITVGLAQANVRKDKYGNSAPKLKLDKGDVYGSNVSVPGDLDLMIGIGADDDFIQKDYRYLQLCKNKISGRNIGFPVRIIPACSKVVSL